MRIEQLADLVTAGLLNEMIGHHFKFDEPIIKSVESRPANFPFLVNGASNNALFLELSVISNSCEIIPGELVLKAGNNTGGTAEREMLFFKLMAKTAPMPQLIRCFGSKWLPEEETGLLLLENSSGNTIIYEGPAEPDLPQYKSAIRGLAELHARWWNHPKLGSGDLVYHWTDDFLAAAIALAEAGFQDLVGHSPELCSATQRELIERVLSELQPLLRKHIESGVPMSISHGDAALWNFVMDKNNLTPAQLVDFQAWCVNPPAWDVGYMIYLLWPPEFRLKFGGEMISTYLEALKAKRIGYSERELMDDLRFCIAGLIGLVLANYQLGIWREEDVNDRLQWLLYAFDQHNCEDLFNLPKNL